MKSIKQIIAVLLVCGMSSLTSGARGTEPSPASIEQAKSHRFEPVVRNIEGWTVHVDPQLLEGEHSETGARTLKMLANHLQRIAIVVPAEPLCGATSPVTLAGNLVIQNVDSLIGVCLTQLVNLGTPVIYGSVASATDFRDLKYITGAIEMGLLNAAGAQMAQFYRLPLYATAGMSDAKVIDAQCGYESALSNLLCALAGANFIHDAAGLLDFALSVSYEKYVVDNEITGMVMRAVEGIRVDENSLAFDLIKEVGPGGHFVAARHTRKYMRTEHYQPTLSERDNLEEWQAKGKKDTYARAAERVNEILSSSGYRLPDGVRQKILHDIPGIIDSC